MKTKISRRPLLSAGFGLLLTACLGLTSTTAQASPASQYPNQPIKLVVPFPAGGATDVLARTIGDKLQQALGQPVLVINKPGASGMIGNQFVARSPADGYTALVSVTSLIQQPAMMDKLPYDPLKDLTPVVMTARVSNIFVVPADSPAKTLKEFVALAKANPGKYNFGSWGAGSSAHIHGALLNQQAGIDLVHVPFQGSSPMMTNLIGGQLSSAFVDVPSARPFFKSMRILAITGPQRLPDLPDVPTFTELGYRSFEPKGWHGIFLPAGTPMPIVQKLSVEINKVLRTPEVMAKIDAIGMAVGGGTPEDFGNTLRTDSVTYAKIIKAANIRLTQ